MTELKTLKGMQIYFSVPWSRKPITFRRGPPWMGNVANLSGPQLKAALALAEAAYSKGYRQYGKIRYKGLNLPAPAVIVAQSVPKGAKVHGGMTRVERAERRHAAAGASIEALRALITAKGS
jgi:hypothetical protein